MASVNDPGSGELSDRGDFEVDEGPEHFHMRARRGASRMTRCALGVLRVELDGIGYEAFATRSLDRMRRELQRTPRMTWFIDASRMRSYEAGYRRVWTRFLQGEGRTVECVILVNSPIVRTGVNLTSTVLGRPVHALSSPEEFESQLRRTMAS